MIDRLGDHLVVNRDCVEAMGDLPDCSVDAIVTDPPYGIGMMGKKWDALPPGDDFAREALRVCKPGAYIVAFGGTRTVHRLTVALEDAGFEIRDTLHWCYWSGFPKSLDVSKAMDKAQGAEREVVARREQRVAFDPNRQGGGGWSAGEVLITAPATEAARQWQGWGTALKPAIEPAVMARKPLTGTVADNVLQWGTGALNIDASRIAYGDPAWPGPQGTDLNGGAYSRDSGTRGAGFAIPRGLGDFSDPGGRFPANLYYCPKASTAEREAGCSDLRQQAAGELTGGREEGSAGLDSPRAGAGRTSDGRGNSHPTVKPIRLMRWIVRLVTPPDGVVLEPFAGSGTTLLATELADIGARCIAIEREAPYIDIIRARFGAREVLRRMLSRPVSEGESETIMRQCSLFEVGS